MPAPPGYWALAERLTAALREDTAWRWWVGAGAPPVLVYVNFDTAESLHRWSRETIEGEVPLGQARVRRYRDRIEAGVYSPNVGSQGSQAEVEQWVRGDLCTVFDALAVRLDAGAAPALP